MSKRYLVSAIGLGVLLISTIVVTNKPVVVEAHSNNITIKDKVAENGAESTSTENEVINEPTAKNVVQENTIIVPVINEKVVTVEKEVIDSPIPLKRVGVFTVKGYCDCSICKPVKNNPRAIRETEGVNVVADLSIIPEGTMLWIEGVGIRQVQPSSRVTKGNNIIVYFDKHEDALKFGINEKIIYKIMN